MIAELHAVRISIDLFGYDILSDFEIAKGYCWNILSGAPLNQVPKDMSDAQLLLDSKWNLKRIIC